MIWQMTVALTNSRLGSVLDLGPMYTTDVRQTSDRQTSDKASLSAPPIRGGA